MKHKMEYISKEDMRKIIMQYKQQIYDLQEKNRKEMEKSSLWQRISFFSWVLMIVSMAASALVR